MGPDPGIIAAMAQSPLATSSSSSSLVRAEGALTPARDTEEQTADIAPRGVLARRGMERLDMMLLCLEALDLYGGEALVQISDSLGYRNRFPNRVELWKRRTFNPMRRACRRGELEPADAEALMRILCRMAERLYPLLRSLLSRSDPPEQLAHRWSLFEGRLAELLQERMNPRRSGVQTLLDPVAGASERRQLIRSLALVAGNGGYARLRASLFDAAA